jgi:hypothetical protein
LIAREIDTGSRALAGPLTRRVGEIDLTLK